MPPADPDPLAPATAATFCATLVDEWVRAGVRHAVVAPGSRSTPMALALQADDRIHLHVHHDERSAAFLALGIGVATGRPAIVLTTSGTAAVELHPAVVEAHHAAVPLVACTADRPAELHDVGAPQTIDQQHLYGRSVRWFADAGVPDEAARGSWRSLAARIVLEATGSPPGPVHLNLPFREPLVGAPADLPPGRDGGVPWHGTTTTAATRRADRSTLDAIARACARREGVIVAGGGIDDPSSVLVLAHALGWPVLADPRSGCRVPDPAVVAHFDAILRACGDELVPEVALRLGSPPASKVLAAWLTRPGTTEIAVERDGRCFDAERSASELIAAEPSRLCRELAARLEDHRPVTPWLQQWTTAQQLAAGAIAGAIAAHPEATEPGVATEVMAALPAGASLVVSSSMPVRDLEWYAAPREGVRVLANRGANGIDGVVSTAIGVAVATRRPTAALLGDLALLHDSNGLLGASDRGCDCTLVVVDNDGGGIFSFLAQANALDDDRFEQLFGTPHRIDLAALVEAYGVAVDVIDRAADVRSTVERSLDAGGVRAVIVHTDRHDNVAVHDAIHAAVANALRDGRSR